MKRNVMVLFVVLLSAGFVQADVLLETNFDGAIANGTQLTNVTWTNDPNISGMVIGGGTINSYETHGFLDAGWEHTGNAVINWNLNTSTATSRGIISSFSAVESVPLGELTIGHVHTTSAGWWQTGNSDMTVTITNSTDGVDVYSNTKNYFYPASGPWQSHTYDVSSVTLEAGKDYTITLTMKNLFNVGGAYASWNKISLKAQAVGVAGGPIVEEEGPTSDTFDIWLWLEPNNDVTITLTESDNQVTLNPSVITFDRDNWDTVKTVTVTAVADGVWEESTHSADITFAVSSEDVFYDGLERAPLTVQVMDGYYCGPWGHLSADINKDCRVDLADFAEIAFQWLECSFKDNPACINAGM